MRRQLLPVLAIAGLTAVVVGCSDDGNPTVGPTPTQSASAQPSATGPSLPAGIDKVITVRYANGKVTGDTDVKLDLDDVVRLTVTSDIADQVHNHAADKSVEVNPGKPVSMTFTASNPGKWDIELEQRKVTLVVLEIR